MRHSTLVVAISAFVAVESLSAQVEAPPQNGWQFEVTPYLWGAGLNGWARIGADTPTVPLNASFSEVWRNLDLGAMASFEARKGRWAILFDSIYIKVSHTTDPLLGGALGTAELGLKETILQLAGAYRVYDSAVVPVDVLAGARYAHISVDSDNHLGRYSGDGLCLLITGNQPFSGWNDVLSTRRKRLWRRRSRISRRFPRGKSLRRLISTP
ncbi:hypothetical protein [Burkholderia sp. S-53]|uniref:hypothetical protein n=1 Tax=Burkholderia sp. S-53 TaxID=2906514 RepID=UPI0021D347F1|nr:hypothetical protein [Burkholderia sp. S-53]UXU86122.1 hypothetical protein LXM88_02250 [Burkholderia sp. S-53]